MAGYIHEEAFRCPDLRQILAIRRTDDLLHTFYCMYFFVIYYPLAELI